MATFPITIPNAARCLLDYIGKNEAPQGYDTIFGNNQKKLPKPITAMTLDEVMANQVNWTRRYKSSAAGRYQFMRATLASIKKECRLSGKELFDKGFQDRAGYYLLLRRDFGLFLAGHMTITAFGLKLAQEWASFPVLADCKGAHRNVIRGQSFYAGDGLNKALYHPAEVEATLRSVLMIVGTDYTPPPFPAEPANPAPPVIIEKEKLPDAVAAEKLDKPLAKSKTVWMWLTSIAGSAGSALAAFSGIDWRVQLALLVLITGFGIYAIKRRADLAKLIKGAVSGE